MFYTAGTNDSNDEDDDNVDFIRRPVKQTVVQITPQVCLKFDFQFTIGHLLIWKPPIGLLSPK